MERGNRDESRSSEDPDWTRYSRPSSPSRRGEQRRNPSRRSGRSRHSPVRSRRDKDRNGSLDRRDGSNQPPETRDKRNRDDWSEDDRSDAGRRRRKRHYHHHEDEEEEDDDLSRDHHDRRSRKRRRRRRQRRRSGSESEDDDRGRADNRVAPPPPRRTGIVSDDEDHLPTAAVSRSDANQGHKSPDRNARHHQQHTRNKPTDKSGKGRSHSSHRDDTAGHFQGGPGTVIADRYRVAQQVGLGTFGKVLECLDLHSQRQQHNSRENNRHPNEGSYVAIKVVRSVKRYCESAKIEASIVSQINRRGGRGRTHCVVLHDAFTYFGHFCLVFESLGPSLYDFMKRHNYRPFPMVCIQDFTVQLLETMEFLHRFGLIHTDLKIENILLMNGRESMHRHQPVPYSTRIKLIDFGGACYDNSKKSSVINTRQYRAPEVIMEAGWSMPSDMWSLGCILAELYRGELLYPTHENIEHLALIERLLGPFPKRVLKRATKLVKEAFDSGGRHRMDRVLSGESLAFVKKAPSSLQSVVRNPDDGWFLTLLADILRVDPEERATAHECLGYLHKIKRDVTCAVNRA